MLLLLLIHRFFLKFSHLDTEIKSNRSCQEFLKYTHQVKKSPKRANHIYQQCYPASPVILIVAREVWIGIGIRIGIENIVS